jgi:hypothetical protein
MEITKIYLIKGQRLIKPGGKNKHWYREHFAVVRADEKEELSAVWRVGNLELDNPTYEEVTLAQALQKDIPFYIDINDEIFNLHVKPKVTVAGYANSAERLVYVLPNGFISTLVVDRTKEYEKVLETLKISDMVFGAKLEEALREVVKGKIVDSFHTWLPVNASIPTTIGHLLERAYDDQAFKRLGQLAHIIDPIKANRIILQLPQIKVATS